MAKFRQVHTTFWQDPRVLEEMTPEDKYFYLYLLTNPNTTQIGIYQITKKQMSFDTGYSSESVNTLLKRFIEIHKVVKYNPNTREIVLLNWAKYNLNKSGKPIFDCIEKELREVKDKNLLPDLMKNIINPDIYELFSRCVNDTYDGTSTIRGQEEEKEKEKEKEEEKEEKEEEEKEQIPFVEIIDHLNHAANTNFRSSSKKTQSLIRSRWKEGFRFNDFTQVINIKVNEWVRNTEMNKYLRPETLFGTKFEAYLNQKGVKHESSPYDNVF